MKKVLLVLGIVVLLASAIFIMFERHETDNSVEVYQGPVRPTDDESYFRETGITRNLEVDNGDKG